MTKYVTDVTQFPRRTFLRLACYSLENEIFRKEAERFGFRRKVSARY